MNNIFDMLFGEVDESKEYFTDDMLAQELGQLILVILLSKELITKEELEEYKVEYKSLRNKTIINEMKKSRQKSS